MAESSVWLLDNSLSTNVDIHVFLTVCGVCCIPVSVVYGWFVVEHSFCI